MKEGRRAGGITAGPESKVLEGNDWEAPMQDGKTVVDHVDYKVCYLIWKLWMSFKLEKILKGSLDLVPSPSFSVKIQVMGSLLEV